MKPSRRLDVLAFALLLAPFPGLRLAAQSQTALTIYNQDFAVVREHVPLDLKAGTNVASFNGVTTQVEPDSVVLRDATGKTALRILEQSYRADAVSTGLMLQLNEGKTITFLVRDKDQKEFPVQGKIIRSGYSPGGVARPYDDNGRPLPAATPIIEVDGKLRFSLPGEPIFPALADDTVLKPTLTWQLSAAAPAKFDAELSYVSGGFTWQAAYNLVAPEKGNTIDLTGWVTVQNNSGAQFDSAKVKLMAGNVNKIQNATASGGYKARAMSAMMEAADAVVTEKSFDEFHLYSLPLPVTLHDRETKQIEIIRATGVKSEMFYVYDGIAADQYRGWDPQSIRNNPDYGTQSNRKIWVLREFKNTKENGLGLPLPKGRTRFYRQDDADKRLEFTGENNLEHTPQGETVRLYTGDSFDLVGERKRTNFQTDNRNQVFDESFEITLRNRKKEPVEIRVVEHLYRWNNWEITEKTDNFTKIDAQTIEFRVKLAPDEEKKVLYRVRYNWQTPAPAARGVRGGLRGVLPQAVEDAIGTLGLPEPEIVPR